MSSLWLVIKSIKLLAPIRCGLLDRVSLSLAGLNLPLNTTVLADANALGKESLRVNAHAAVWLPSHDRVSNGNSNVCILVSHAAQSQCDRKCAHS
jgi:hypothetical protein